VKWKTAYSKRMECLFTCVLAYYTFLKVFEMYNQINRNFNASSYDISILCLYV